MPKYTATRGTNCRRYFDTEVEAATPKEAFEKAKALMGTESALDWLPSRYGHRISDDLSEPCCATEDALSITDKDGEVQIDFTDVPNDVEPTSYGDLLAFARRMAWMTTPQDEFEDDPQGFEDVEGLVADMSDDRLFSEYHIFMEMVREARALLKFPKED